MYYLVVIYCINAVKAKVKVKVNVHESVHHPCVVAVICIRMFMWMWTNIIFIRDILIEFLVNAVYTRAPGGWEGRVGVSFFKFSFNVLCIQSIFFKIVSGAVSLFI